MPSACSWAPQRDSFTSSSCASGFCSAGNLLWPLQSARGSVSITPLGTLLWAPLFSSLVLCKPLAQCCSWDIFCHIQPGLEQLSCLASGEEQAPTVTIPNTLYCTPWCVNCGLPGPLLHPSPLLLAVPFKKNFRFSWKSEICFSFVSVFSINAKAV